MKKFRISIFGLLVMMFAVVALLSSCEKEEAAPVVPQYRIDDAPVPGPDPHAPNYFSIPREGEYTPMSSRKLTIKGAAATFQGGVIKAKISHRQGNVFFLDITKQDGSKFRNPVVVGVKSGSVYGEVHWTKEASAGESVVFTYFHARFARGYEHFYPIVMDAKTGECYYAEPILVYTDPLYANVCGEGEVFGTANGVEVRCTGENASADFCLRYIEKVYQEKIQNASKPKDWYTDTNNFKHFSRYPNGGDVAPRVGDILVFSSYDRLFSEEGDGHVAIVMEVTDTSIRVAQQNFSVNVESSYWYPIGGEFQRSGNRIIDPEPGNVMRGCIVTPEPKHSIIGWMRYQKN